VRYADLMLKRDKGDLAALLEGFAEFWKAIPKVERPSGSTATLANDVLSYRSKLDGLAPEELALLWRSVDWLLRDVAKLDPKSMVEEERVVRDPNALVPGRYWILPPGKFFPCDDHVAFAEERQNTFVDVLGLDGWQFLRAKHSGGNRLIPLLLEHGAAIAMIGKEAGMKVAGFQCSQVAVPWLKAKALRLPIPRVWVRVWTPGNAYNGWGSGLLFILKRGGRQEVV